MRRVMCLIFLILLAMPVLAQDVPDYKEKYVNDFASVFTSGQADELRSLFKSIEDNTTAEVTVLTVETVYPMSTSQYAEEVFDKWKIGKAETDNGLLILYAKTEDKIWVSTGYGLEGILPDSKVGRILDETFVPARAAGESASGIVLAAHEYAAVINANADEVRAGRATGAGEFPIFAFLPLFFMLFFIIAMVWHAYNETNPKCPYCKGRMRVVKTEVKKKKEKGPLGIEITKYYTLVTYKCKKCGRKVVKKKEGRYRKSGAFLIGYGAGGGFGGGGFGGGFGGGGFGGGGAGR